MTKNSAREIQWNDDNVGALWDFAPTFEPYAKMYLSRQASKGIVRCLQHITPLSDSILDYGCGAGDLLAELLRKNISCQGLDFSTESVAAVNARFSTNPLWKGAKRPEGNHLPYHDGQFDLIICLDTVEHIMPEHMDSLNELKRILKPETGWIFISTPNAENLQTHKIFCPNCRQIFHKWQHVRSFTVDTLKELMEQYGFVTSYCNTTSFIKWQTPLWPGMLDLSPRVAYRIVRTVAARMLDLLPLPFKPFGGFTFQQFVGKGNNLFWLGKRK